MIQTRFLVLMLVCSIMFAAGQTCWKVGLQQHGFNLSGQGFLALAGSLPIWAGFFLFGVATLIWFDVLSKFPLSLAYPFVSLSYVFGLLAAKYVFGETISLTRWLGVLLICFGVALVGRQTG